MYSLDINFLKDRPEYQPQQQGPKPAPMPAGSMTPLVAGIIVGLLLPGIVGGLWLFLQQQNSQLAEQNAALDQKLAELQIGQKRIEALNKQITDVNAETNALATVFNQIKPWSATLQDIRERVPPQVRIATIKQEQVTPTAAPAPAPSPAAGTPNTAGNNQATTTPLPTTKLTIAGSARSFDDVNYFLLTLKRSPFLQGDETQLMRAELVQNPARLEVNRPESLNQSAAKVTYTLPKLVKYEIQTTLSELGASELIRELDRKGAVGLVTRIRTLQQQGVLQK